MKVIPPFGWTTFIITSELDTTYTASKGAEYEVLEDAGAAKRYNSDNAVERLIGMVLAGVVFAPCACVEKRVAEMSTFVDLWLAYQTL
jgi:hypothetical protein